MKIRFHLNGESVNLKNTSFGHGITTTPLQLAKAYAILGNGGYKIDPFILKDKTKLIKPGNQITSQKTTSNEINSILRKVSLDEGTANFANIEGYVVAGKTGTAVKYKTNFKLNISRLCFSQQTKICFVGYVR